MGTTRLEAFSDGVIAIIVTIMVLELKIPHSVTAEALAHLLPTALSYVLSFFLVAIMWVNHHHVVHSLKHVNGRVLWRNIHLLFWMSLIPFSTGLIGEGHKEALAACIYGLNLTACSLAFSLLTAAAAGQQPQNDTQRAHDAARRRREAMTAVLYGAGAALAFVSVALAYAIYVLLPLMYFLPERQLATTSH